MRGAFLIFCFLLWSPNTVEAENGAIPGQSRCPLALPQPVEQWTPQERWAWERICLGYWANMSMSNVTDPHSEDRDGLPCRPSDFRESSDSKKFDLEAVGHRVLSSKFLELVVAHKPWSSSPRRPQVRIKCAIVPEELDLQNFEVSPEFYLDDSWLGSGVNLFGSTFDRVLSFEGSTVIGHLNAQGLKVGGGLWLSSGNFEAVSFSAANINGNINADNARFKGILNAEQIRIKNSVLLRDVQELEGANFRLARIGGNLETTSSSITKTFDARRAIIGASAIFSGEGVFADIWLHGATVGGGIAMGGGSQFTEVVLRGTKVDGNVEAEGSTFAQTFNADRLDVRGNLHLRGGSRFSGVNLLEARIGGNIDALGSTFSGRFDADGAEVSGSVLLRDGGSFEDLDFLAARIEKHLQLPGSEFSGELNLTGAQVGVLVLDGAGVPALLERGHIDPLWNDGAKLTLRDTRVGVLQAPVRSWRSNERWVQADLSGFQYDRVGSVGSESSGTLLDASGAELVTWLDGVRPVSDFCSGALRSRALRATR